MYNGNDNRKRISNTGICRQGRRSRNGKRQCRNCGRTSESYFNINSLDSTLQIMNAQLGTMSETLDEVNGVTEETS